MAIDTKEPYSDGWWLKRCYDQLRDQQKRCKALQDRYEGNGPVPYVSDIQRDVVRWFVEKSRTNFERLIVNSVLSRLEITGLRTAADDGDGGDAAAYRTWKTSRGELWSMDAHQMALSMSQSYVIVGLRPDGRPLVTAEDPRLMTAITDPTDPWLVVAALKLFHDDVAEQDVAYLYLPGRVMVARADRKRRGSADPRFNPAAYSWDVDLFDAEANLVAKGASGPIPGFAEIDSEGNITGRVCVVPYYCDSTTNPQALFEPFLPAIDRINQQILQRMTIATVQAFRQRAFKGLPKTDPVTGENIDYDAIFIADPGAVWNIPETAEIWESGQVDLTPIIAAIREDRNDLAATSGTPLYAITPDAANGSAEGASLQREQTIFNCRRTIKRFNPSDNLTLELMFQATGDQARSAPGTVEVMWGPVQIESMASRANAIAQTKGVMSRRQQLIEIWGQSPDEADRTLSELTGDFVLDQTYGVTTAAVATGAAA